MIDRNGSLSPSAFIPFCSFGGDYHAMGTNYSNFLKIPVCNSFQARVRDKHICYEIDLEQYRMEHKHILKQLQEGLVLFLDYNEDKQLSVKKGMKRNENEAQIYMDTISIIMV